MLQSEFIQMYYEWNKEMERKLSDQIAIPCNCGDESCHGWAMVSIDWLLQNM